MKKRFFITALLSLLFVGVVTNTYADDQFGSVDPNADPREVLGELFPDCLFSRPPVLPNNVYDIAQQTGGFTIFLQAVDIAGLTDLLTGEEGFTVLAPTDAAFNALPAGVLDDLIANPGDLRQVLLHHIIQDPYLDTEIPLGQLRTSLGKNLSVTAGPVFDGTARIVDPNNTMPSNGVLHGINQVIVPPIEDFTTRSRPEAPPQELTVECDCNLELITAAQEGRAPGFGDLDAQAQDILSSGNTMTYVVQSGDSLGGIAYDNYGNAGLWTMLFDVNGDQLSDPSLIYVGMELTVPVR